MYDDSQPVHAALSLLIDDGYATDRQRETAKMALQLIETLESESVQVTAERDALRAERQTIRNQVDKLVNSDFVCSRCGSQQK